MRKHATSGAGKPARSRRAAAAREKGGVRLHVILARAGVASRRHAEELIRERRVTLNGDTVTQLGVRADPTRDRIKVDGQLVRSRERREYFMFNKPPGFVTTMADPEGRPCVGDLVADLGARVYPVGRLDFSTSGLLLLTNDGGLCARITHPSSHIEKRYIAKINGVPTDEDVERLRNGLRLKDGMTAKAFARVDKRVGNKTWIELGIVEGRNRQVRRMLEAVGFRVEKLRRVAIGPLRLGDLTSGSVRRLTSEEVSALERVTREKASKLPS